jgi:hypothetical protein
VHEIITRKNFIHKYKKTFFYAIYSGQISTQILPSSLSPHKNMTWDVLPIPIHAQVRKGLKSLENFEKSSEKRETADPTAD